MIAWTWQPAMLPHRHLSQEERTAMINAARLRCQNAKIALMQAEAHERYVMTLIQNQAIKLSRTRVGA